MKWEMNLIFAFPKRSSTRPNTSDFQPFGHINEVRRIYSDFVNQDIVSLYGSISLAHWGLETCLILLTHFHMHPALMQDMHILCLSLLIRENCWELVTYQVISFGASCPSWGGKVLEEPRTVWRTSCSLSLENLIWWQLAVEYACLGILLFQ